VDFSLKCDVLYSAGESQEGNSQLKGRRNTTHMILMAEFIVERLFLGRHRELWRDLFIVRSELDKDDGYGESAFS
jgi:hypothetical protein